jgi:hypothetical protein
MFGPQATLDQRFAVYSAVSIASWVSTNSAPYRDLAGTNQE